MQWRRRGATLGQRGCVGGGLALAAALFILSVTATDEHGLRRGGRQSKLHCSAVSGGDVTKRRHRDVGVVEEIGARLQIRRQGEVAGRLARGGDEQRNGQRREVVAAATRRSSSGSILLPTAYRPVEDKRQR